VTNTVVTQTSARLLAHEIEKHPRIGIVVGALTTISCLVLAVYNWNEYKELNKPPIEMKVAEAFKVLNSGERKTLKFTDAIPDCSKSIKTNKEGFYEIPFSDEYSNILIVGEYSGTRECPPIPEQLTGVVAKHVLEDKPRYFSRLKERSNFELESYKEDTGVLDVCIYCGPTNSLIGVVVCSAVALCGLLLIFWAPRMHKQYMERLSKATDSDIRSGGSI